MAKEVRKTTDNTTDVACETVESKYTAVEIARNAVNLFGKSHDIAEAALAYNGVTDCTVDEARQIIEAFAERKVK